MRIKDKPADTSTTAMIRRGAKMGEGLAKKIWTKKKGKRNKTTCMNGVATTVAISSVGRTERSPMAKPAGQSGINEKNWTGQME